MSDPWRPFPGGQTEFLQRGEFEALYGGLAGPGKTDCIVAAATRYTWHPGYRGLILRRTFPQLTEVIDRCYERYPSIGGVYRSGEHRWHFPSGAIITLGHMQHESDKYNYQGKEFHFIGFDELTQFLESQYLYLFSRARSVYAELTPQIRASTNPGGIGHRWVKDRFIDVAKPGHTYVDKATGFSRIFIKGVREDNPKLLQNDPNYERRLDLLPEIERLRLKDGIWDAFEGQVFTELSQRVHGAPPFDVPPEWYKFMSFDWGFSKPFAVGWYAVDFDGVVWKYREWYGCHEGQADKGLKISPQEIAQGIFDRETEKVNARIADPAIWSRTPDKHKYGIKGPSVHEDMAGQGLFFIKADNDRIQGKMQVHKRFEIETDVDESTGEVLKESPRFYCFNDCKEFWRTFPLLRESSKNPEDVETEQEDHIYDETRYAFMFRPLKPKRINQVPPGSFAAERQKLIRAKRYAKRHGVSLHQAYGKIR